MRRGGWHQFGDRSQHAAREVLEAGAGVGVILSPRDLREQLAIRYSPTYRSLGAEVLVDPQFYESERSIGMLESYRFNRYRGSVAQLGKITESELDRLAGEMEGLHRQVQATGVIAPAVLYEAGGEKQQALNKRLFTMAKKVAESIGVPTYATVGLSRSVTGSESNVMKAVSAASSLDADGWYYFFEFGGGRVPESADLVERCCVACLSLASTGKPVIQAFAGPLAILSFAYGAAGAGIGHNQNLWQYSPQRWKRSAKGGGGGKAPPRLFSESLWGTIVYPDEVARLPIHLRNRIVARSPFASNVGTSPPFLPLGKWEAGKHLVYQIAARSDQLAGTTHARQVATEVKEILENAVAVHTLIQEAGVALKDGTDRYQHIWLGVIEKLEETMVEDLDFIELAGE